MNSDDYAELRSDMARAMNLADAKKVMKKFLRKAGPGYLEDCPVVNNSGMRSCFNRPRSNWRRKQSLCPRSGLAGRVNNSCSARPTATWASPLLAGFTSMT